MQGQTLVEEDESFLDPYYVYYIGFGPLHAEQRIRLGAGIPRWMEEGAGI